MDYTATESTNKIKKLHIKETVEFAIKYIPQVDRATLEGFLDLVNTSGTFGSITNEEIVEKMQLALKYIPGTCVNSLMILVELLGIQSYIVSQARHALTSSSTMSVTGYVEALIINAEM